MKNRSGKSDDKKNVRGGSKRAPSERSKVKRHQDSRKTSGGEEGTMRYDKESTRTSRPYRNDSKASGRSPEERKQSFSQRPVRKFTKKENREGDDEKRSSRYSSEKPYQPTSKRARIQRPESGDQERPLRKNVIKGSEDYDNRKERYSRTSRPESRDQERPSRKKVIKGSEDFDTRKERYSRTSRPESGDQERPFRKKVIKGSEDYDTRKERYSRTSRSESRDQERPFRKKVIKGSENYDTRKERYSRTSRPGKIGSKDHDTGKDKYSRPVKPGNKGDGVVRLNKYIADAGICSRREADDLISSGAVKVNGEVITVLGTKVNPTDKVQIGDQTLSREVLRYILLNKPKGYITTLEDPEGRKTVMFLVRDACKERIYPVGRLDRNTTGVLLFTNDGEMAKKLTHPKYGIRKMYHVVLDQPLTQKHMNIIEEGIELEDGVIKVDAIAYVGDGKDRRQLGVEIHSGKNRIVRRIFEELGYTINTLDRVIFAGLTKKDLPRGRWRHLTKEEVSFLKMQG